MKSSQYLSAAALGSIVTGVLLLLGLGPLSPDPGPVQPTTPSLSDLRDLITAANTHFHVPPTLPEHQVVSIGTLDFFTQIPDTWTTMITGAGVLRRVNVAGSDGSGEYFIRVDGDDLKILSLRGQPGAKSTQVLDVQFGTSVEIRGKEINAPQNVSIMYDLDPIVTRGLLDPPDPGPVEPTSPSLLGLQERIQFNSFSLSGTQPGHQIVSIGTPEVAGVIPTTWTTLITGSGTLRRTAANSVFIYGIRIDGDDSKIVIMAIRSNNSGSSGLLNIKFGISVEVQAASSSSPGDTISLIYDLDP